MGIKRGNFFGTKCDVLYPKHSRDLMYMLANSSESMMFRMLTLCFTLMKNPKGNREM